MKNKHITYIIFAFILSVLSFNAANAAPKACPESDTACLFYQNLFERGKARLVSMQEEIDNAKETVDELKESRKSMRDAHQRHLVMLQQGCFVISEDLTTGDDGFVETTAPSSTVTADNLDDHIITNKRYFVQSEDVKCTRANRFFTLDDDETDTNNVGESTHMLTIKKQINTRAKNDRDEYERYVLLSYNDGSDGAVPSVQVTPTISYNANVRVKVRRTSAYFRADRGDGAAYLEFTVNSNGTLGSNNIGTNDPSAGKLRKVVAEFLAPFDEELANTYRE